MGADHVDKAKDDKNKTRFFDWCEMMNTKWVWSLRVVVSRKAETEFVQIKPLYVQYLNRKWVNMTRTMEDFINNLLLYNTAHNG